MIPAVFRRLWTAARTRVKALVLRARRLKAAGRPAEAEALLERAIAEDPNACLRWDAETDRLSGRRDFVAALDRLNVLVRDDASEYALVARSETLREPLFNRVDESRADLDAAAALRPEKAWIRAFAGRSRFYSPERERGLADLDRALSLQPLGWAHAWRGEARRVNGDLEGAFADFVRAEELTPAYPWLYAWRGAACAARGDWARAAADLDVYLSVFPTDRRSLLQRARARRRLGRVDLAAADLRLALRDELNGAALGAGSVPPEEAEERREAAADYAAYLAKRPKDAWARALLGEEYLRLGAHEEAARELEASLKAAPGSAWARTWLAETRLGQRRHDDARREVEAALKAEPAYRRASVLRGWLERRDCDYARAAEDFARAGDAAWVLAWRGESLLRLGRLKEADAALTRALSLHPRYADALAWRGETRRRRGLRDAAREDFAAALSVDAGHGQARLSLALLGDEGKVLQ